MVWFLTLTFYVSGAYGGTLGATTIPHQFTSYEECQAAAEQSKDDYNGGARVEWVCTSAKI